MSEDILTISAFVHQNLEQLTIRCSDLDVGEDGRSKQAEAGHAGY
ncbi:MAG: hypothetical protein ACYTF6_02670 [Planctomycetota bacterium]|jgi:hypothetical protein